jgi:membrane-associated phospholipid phosphatase
LSEPTAALEIPPPARGWLREAGRRIRTLWVLKMTGTVVCMTAFFVVYFWLLNHARHPVTTVPRIFVDRLIPFNPWALPLYVSLWVYVPLAPSLLVTRRELGSYALAAAALSVIGFAVFIAWPTAVPGPEDPSIAPSLSFLKAVDASGNAFPSLHVAFAVFTAIWFERLLRMIGAGGVVRALSWLWCAGIVYSTIAIRQHVALDALAGIVLGALVACVHLRVAHAGAPARTSVTPTSAR